MEGLTWGEILGIELGIDSHKFRQIITSFYKGKMRMKT
ncbi:MAG: hypothetical protein H6Q76_2474, partial [Firmicutes bacterium]|nr:hypothetical protein [Bacillota bacterium]